MGVAVLLGSLIARARAAEPRVDLQGYRPDTPTGRGFRLDEVTVLPHLQYGAAFDLTYARTSLRLVAPGEPTYYAIQRSMAGVVTAGFGFRDRFEANVAVPLVLFQNSFAPPGYGQGATLGLGDLRLGGRAIVWESAAHPLAVGAGLTLAVPITHGALINERTPWVEPRVFGEYRLGPAKVLARLGYRYRGSTSLYGTALGPELDVGLGGQMLLLPTTRVIAELAGATAAGSGFLGRQQTPLELTVGARHHLGPLGIAIGGGPGLAPGYGAPTYRVIASASFAPSGADWDRDGVPDPKDACPTVREDRDGFEDGDGCPDPDNDKDGLLDAADKCPNEPETKNEFEDEDGCPDQAPVRDRDGDGIPDGTDKCPEQPEDKDGFEDEDGCPDPDNDKDGIPDTADKCPNEPESKNGVEDEDGCPEALAANEVRVGERELELGEKVYFDLNEYRVRSRFRPVLAQVAATLKAHPEIGRCAVEGHTDDTGTPEFNQALSVQRAEAVVKILVELGVDPARLSAIGQGEGKPWAPNDGEEGRAKNRRVLFHIERGSGPGAGEGGGTGKTRRSVPERSPRPPGKAAEALAAPKPREAPKPRRSPAGRAAVTGDDEVAPAPASATKRSAAPARKRSSGGKAPVLGLPEDTTGDVPAPRLEREASVKPEGRKKPPPAGGSLRDLIKLPPRETPR